MRDRVAQAQPDVCARFDAEVMGEPCRTLVELGVGTRRVARDDRGAIRYCVRHELEQVREVEAGHYDRFCDALVRDGTR